MLVVESSLNGLPKVPWLKVCAQNFVHLFSASQVRLTTSITVKKKQKYEPEFFIFIFHRSHCCYCWLILSFFCCCCCCCYFSLSIVTRLLLCICISSFCVWFGIDVVVGSCWIHHNLNQLNIFKLLPVKWVTRARHWTQKKKTERNVHISVQLYG